MKLSGWVALAATSVLGLAAQAQDGCERCRGKRVVEYSRDHEWGPREWGFHHGKPDFFMYRGGFEGDRMWTRRAPGPEMDRRFIERAPERRVERDVIRRAPPGAEHRFVEREQFEHHGGERWQHEGPGPHRIEKRIIERHDRDDDRWERGVPVPPPHPIEKRIIERHDRNDDRWEREVPPPPHRIEKRIERAPDRDQPRFEKRIERDAPPHAEKRIERAPAEKHDLGGALDKISRVLDNLEQRLSSLEKRLGDRK